MPFVPRVTPETVDVKISPVMVVVLCTSSYDAYGNTCMNFYEHILDGFKVVERT